MENKYMKYGLIAGAIFVWGAIIIRIVGGLSVPAVPAYQPASAPLPPTLRIPDGYVLFADYPDPFLPEPDSTGESDANKISGPMAAAPLTKAPTPPPAPPIQSFIKYVGVISNPEKKLKIAILSINGKELLIKEKEKKEGLLVRKIGREKITIVYKGEYAEIEKND